MPEVISFLGDPQLASEEWRHVVGAFVHFGSGGGGGICEEFLPTRLICGSGVCAFCGVTYENRRFLTLSLVFRGRRGFQNTSPLRELGRFKSSGNIFWLHLASARDQEGRVGGGLSLDFLVENGGERGLSLSHPTHHRKRIYLRRGFSPLEVHLSPKPHLCTPFRFTVGRSVTARKRNLGCHAQAPRRRLRRAEVCFGHSPTHLHIFRTVLLVYAPRITNVPGMKAREKGQASLFFYRGHRTQPPTNQIFSREVT